jgi:hypothetical protein
MRTIPRPEPGQYAPDAARYVDRVPDERVLDHLAGQLLATRAFFGSLPDALHGFRYAEGKWSVREVLQHVVDAERVFAFRAFTFARGDRAELPGFEENDYVPASEADRRPLADILAEYVAVRESTLALLDGLPEAALTRTGVANGRLVSVPALAYQIVGHERHHLAILQERYLSQAGGGERDPGGPSGRTEPPV